MWLVAAVVAALGVGVVVWLMSGDGDEVGSPTATFDGAGVTYTGPDPVVLGDDGFWTVTIVNETDEAVLVGVASLTEPNPTFEEYLEFTDNYDGTRLPWVDEFVEETINAGETIERDVKMSGTVTIDFLKPRADKVYTSGFITVVAGDE